MEAVDQDRVVQQKVTGLAVDQLIGLESQNLDHVLGPGRSHLQSPELRLVQSKVLEVNENCQVK